MSNVTMFSKLVAVSSHRCLAAFILSSTIKSPSCKQPTNSFICPASTFNEFTCTIIFHLSFFRNDLLTSSTPSDGCTPTNLNVAHPAWKYAFECSLS